MPIEFPMRGETRSLTPELRDTLPGAFVRLPDGVTHYQLAGPEDAPVVVLVHGFSVPYFIWIQLLIFSCRPAVGPCASTCSAGAIPTGRTCAMI